MNEETASKKKKIILIIVAAVILLLGIILFFLWRSKITATTMRILRIEGTVTLEDDGKEKTITNNLRLNSGNALTTALKSLVSIGLDDTKIVTLDEKSRAEFNQSGRKIELNLTAGSLFFEVQKPLDNDESFDISTSTMVVGIRGTSGWVSVDGEHESLIITDGVVHVIGTNPVTGEVKEIDVKAGQRVNVYLYNDRKIDSIMFELIEVTERDLPEFLLERLREKPQLLDKVCRETGWDKPWILGVREEDVPKVVMNSDGSDDSGDDEDISEIEDTEALVPDTGDATDTDSNDHDRDTVLTQEELDWAHSHVAIVDPATGVFALKDMTLFDPAFYAATNPDVVAKYGSDPDALLWHYLQRGKREGRPPIAPPTPTPTPTPVWTSSVQEESSEEPEEEEPEPTPTAVPAPPTPGTNIPISTTYPNPLGSNQPYFSLNGGNVQGYIDNTNLVVIPTGGNLTLPLNINGSYTLGGAGATPTTYNNQVFNSLNDINWTYSGNGYGGTVSGGDLSVTTANGNTMTRYQNAPNVAKNPNSYQYSVTDANGDENFYPNEADAIANAP